MKAVLASMLAAALAASACGASGDEQRVLTVFAAASLTDSFIALKERFEDAHPGVEVKLNLAGSSSLAQQIIEGAPVDVFAPADEQNMDKVVDQDLVEDVPEIFATNTLTIATAPGNPHDIDGLADLGSADLTVVVCVPQAPCGAATEQVEQTAGISLNPASEEENVKAVLTKVELGEADAGLVYVTDVFSSDAVGQVSFPEADSAINAYPIAVLEEAPEPELASAFRDLVLGETGQAELSKVGFGAP